jgi:regulator of replication initiation timing
MRKNIDDRFKIDKDGELYTVESLVRDKVDGEFLLGVYEQMQNNVKNLAVNLENIPKQIESLKQQVDVTIPTQIKSIMKKMEKLEPVIAEIKAKQAKEEADKKPTGDIIAPGSTLIQLPAETFKGKESNKTNN